MSIDVKTAFLYPPLPDSEVIFMRRPKGITDAQLPAIMRLRKCIYGLPQASRYFNDHLSATLLSNGFKRLISDPQIYIEVIDDKKVICSTHVDDLLCAATKTLLYYKICQRISLQFTILPLRWNQRII